MQGSATPDFGKTMIHMYDLLICLSNVGDIISPEVADHHQQVAYLAFQIAERLDLSAEQKKDLVLAGLLHDVGAFSLDERLTLIEDEPPSASDHAMRGARLLEAFAPLGSAAQIIRHHHVPWKNGEGVCFRGQEVSYLSHIIHLADRVAVSVDRGRDIIGQIQGIREKMLRQSGSVFAPELVEAFMDVSTHEYIWLDIVYKPLLYILPDIVSFSTVELNLDGMLDLSRVFANIIDFRSPFTANHSAGVAQTAEKLAEFSGFSEQECKMMRVAGYLHDFGKLAVSRNVLEKPGKLDAQEVNIIRSHTFYTYRLLQSIKGFETINQWASFHHEKLNGQGYPFHLTGSNIPLGSRIMAVADIFTAIMEDRPYRKGMSSGQAAEVLSSMVEDQSICPYVVSILMDHFCEIDGLRAEAQRQAAQQYKYVVDL